MCETIINMLYGCQRQARSGLSNMKGFSRRKYLNGIGSVAFFSLINWIQTAQASSPRSRRGSSGLDLSGIPEDNRDPFLMVNHAVHILHDSDMGWENIDEDQVIEEILRLDPGLINELDLTGWHGPPKDTGIFERRHQSVQDFAHVHHLPYTCGVHWEFNPDMLHSDWYSQLPEDEKWRYLDGSIVEHPSEILAKDIEGEPHIRAEGHENLVPSLFAEGTKDRLVRTGQELFKLGVNQFWIDTPVQGLIFDFDFSIWAQSAFEQHLDSLSHDRLDELGIDDPAEFDIVEYLTQHNLAPGDTNQPQSDPVFREYMLFQHRSNNSFVDELFEEIRADLPPEVEDGGTTVFGLGFGLQYHYLDPASIYKSDAVDVISIETQPTVPPDRPHDVSVKIGRAAGKFEKPVRVWGRMNEPFGTTDGLDTDEYYETLFQFQMAQVYCHGGRRSIPLTSLPNVSYDESVNSWMRPDGTISENLHQFADFVRAHKRFLEDVTEANRVVIAVSLPTLLWQRLPGWPEGRTTRHSSAIGEAAITLRREHIPYDVHILDHPQFWEDSAQLERLAEYDCVILPGVECVSDDHVAAVQDALKNGTTVIATGGAPTQNEEYMEREDVAELLESEDAATVIDAEPDISGTGDGAEALRDALGEVERQVVLETDADVSLNVVEQSNPDRVIVHLLNFEYDRETDEMQELEEISLSVKDLPFSPEAASYYTVDGITEMAMNVNGKSVTVTVPHLDMWGFVVFGESADALAAPVPETEAKESISDAEELIDQLDDPEAYPEGRIARAKIQNTEPALDYEAYDVAQKLAEDAETFANVVLEGDTNGQDDTEDEEDADDTEDEEVPEADDEVPGFGVGAALASIVGVAYLMNRGQSEDQTQTA